MRWAIIITQINAIRTSLTASCRLILRSPFGLLTLFLILYASVLMVFWDGLGPRDELQYISAALDWYETGPVLGETHWSLRSPLILPMAAIFSIFGPSEFGASAPNILFGSLLVVISFTFARRTLGHLDGNIFTALVATSAFLTIQPSELRIYGIEIIFVATSLWLLAERWGSPGADLHRLYLAGLAAGGAWLCRESTIFLPIAIGAVALITPARFFRTVLPAAAGFFSIILSEMLYYQVVAGDALYRFKIDINHGGGEPSTKIGGPMPDETSLHFFLHPINELLTYPTVTPFFVIAMAAFAYLRKTKMMSEKINSTLIVFVIATAMSFFISGYFLSLEYVEYYPIVLYTSLLFCTLAIATIYRRYGAIMGSIPLGIIVVLSFAAADFRDYGEYDEARLLADLIEDYEQPICSDRLTSMRTQGLLRLRGMPLEAATRMAPPYDDSNECALVFNATPAGDRYWLKPEPQWAQIGVWFPRKTSWTRAVLRIVTPDAIKSPRLKEILQAPNPTILYHNYNANDEDGKTMLSLPETRV